MGGLSLVLSFLFEFLKGKEAMGIRDHQTPDLFIKALRRHVPGFMEIDPTLQVRMADFIWVADRRTRAHETQAGNSSFGYKELENAFGRGQFKILNDSLGIFVVTEKWSKVNHTTKGYRLTELVQRVKDQYLFPPMSVVKLVAKSSELESDEVTAMISMDARKIVRLPNVLAAKDTDGNTAKAWRNTKLVKSVPVNLPVMYDMQRKLSEMLTCPNEDMFAQADADYIETRLESIGQLIVLANTDVAGRGYVAHRYMEQSTGRIGGQGISLQNAPRIVRKAALHGMFDYDIENCQYAIFSHLARQYGFPCFAIDHYLANKSKTREGLALRIGISIGDVKTVLLALMFGSPLSPREENAIPQAIGRDKALLLYEDAEFAAIANDIKAGRKMILAKWPDRTLRTLKNAMGKTISIKAGAPKKLAHLLQGIEADALRAVLRAFGGAIVLPVHDGFVSLEKLDVKLVEQVIFDATGINLKVHEERISISADFEFTKVLKAA